jgi:CHAT domain-containing protein
MSINRWQQRLCLFFLSALALVCLSGRGTAGPADWQQAQDYYQQGQYRKVIEILVDSQNTANPTIHEYLAAAYEKTGQLSLALAHWHQAAQLYQRQGNSSRAATALVAQAQVYVDLGQPQAALDRLERMALPLPTTALGVLGNAYLVAGDYEQAVAAFERLLNSPLPPGQQLAALNNLRAAQSNRARRCRQQAQFLRQEGEKGEADRQERLARQWQQSAKETAERAGTLAGKLPPTASSLQAQLAWLPYLPEAERPPYLKEIESRLESLPPSHESANLWLSLAAVAPAPEAARQQAAQIAQAVGDDLALALAWGELGRSAEGRGDYALALNYTERAQQAAHPHLAYHQLYLWQWQEGRLYQAQGQLEAATSAYRRAAASLQKIRSEIASASRDVQFDFQEQVEPVYRGLLSLLLEQEPPGAEELAESLEIFERWQLAQLENLFGDTCFEAPLFEANQWLSRQKAALLVALSLENQLHVIVQLPDGTYQHQAQALPSGELSQRLATWRRQLQQVTEQQYLNNSAFFYRLLVAPFESALAQAGPSTLVFVGDGWLRNVPMAALYDPDHRQYLVEKYPVAVALGRNFLHPPGTAPTSALTFGLAVPRPPLNIPLPYVADETRLVGKILGGEQFLDEQFTVKRLGERLAAARPTLLHLATHGRFTGSPDTSFLQAYDGPLSLNQLERLLLESDSPLDLLALSACETSAGNSRAVLGLAGVAVRAGARSVLGTLWSVSDDVTLTVIEDFYEHLKSGMSKAQALQRVQVRQIQSHAHPRSWSPFLLIGL